MSEEWKMSGQLALEKRSAEWIVRIAGNLHRDLAVGERDALERQVRSMGKAPNLIVDLSDVLRLDSWGEERIADAIDNVIAGEGKVGVLFDPARGHYVRSLRVLLERHGSRIRFDASQSTLERWLGEA